MRAAREEAGLSLRRAADALGVSDNALGSWELGKRKRRLPRRRVEQLETIYGIEDGRLLRAGGYVVEGTLPPPAGTRSLAYGGAPLTPEEEIDVRRYIDFVRSRRS